MPFDKLYFNDITLRTSYSCGPRETRQAMNRLAMGELTAEQVVSDFISMDELPAAYQAMKRGELLKAMVVFA
jgi:L-iditol 2-dehydrogenase